MCRLYGRCGWSCSLHEGGNISSPIVETDILGSLLLKLLACVNFRAEMFSVVAKSPAGDGVDMTNNDVATSSEVSASKPVKDVMPGLESRRGGEKHTATVHPIIIVDSSQSVYYINDLVYDNLCG